MPDNHHVGTFEGHGKKSMRYAIFRSERPVARGTIVLLHGRNETIEKYFETIRDLTAKGFWVATFDTRGQGGSARLLKKADAGYVRRFFRLPEGCIALSGTGGAAGYAPALLHGGALHRRADCAFHGAGTVQPHRAHGALLALRRAWGQSVSPRWIKTVATALTWTGFGGKQLGRDNRERDFDGNPLTSDAERFARNIAIANSHPELFIGRPTARWLYEVMKIMPKVTRQDHLTRITIPTLLLAPVLDTITPYAVQEELSRNFRAAQLIPVIGAATNCFRNAISTAPRRLRRWMPSSPGRIASRPKRVRGRRAAPAPLHAQPCCRQR